MQLDLASMEQAGPKGYSQEQKEYAFRRIEGSTQEFPRPYFSAKRRGLRCTTGAVFTKLGVESIFDKDYRV